MDVSHPLKGNRPFFHGLPDGGSADTGTPGGLGLVPGGLFQKGEKVAAVKNRGFPGSGFGLAAE